MENIRNMVGDCGRGLLMLVTGFEQCGPNPAAEMGALGSHEPSQLGVRCGRLVIAPY